MTNHEKILKFFGEWYYLYDMLGDHYRAKAYKKASRVVSSLDEISAEKAREAGVGDHISAKIPVILASNDPPDELVKLREEVRGQEELSNIFGVGPATAAKWIDSGVTNIQSLRKAVANGAISLTAMQKHGLKFAEDLKKRIQRNEITKIADTLRGIFTDGGIILDRFDIAGSYRRGSQDSGDVDILLSTSPEMFARIRTLLLDRALIISAGDERIMMLTRGLAGIMRQIDIMNSSTDTYAAALLYFTGSWTHNEMMRGRAKVLGMKLNQRGLYKDGILIPAQTEHDIYRELGLPYVEPKDR